VAGWTVVALAKQQRRLEVLNARKNQPDLGYNDLPEETKDLARQALPAGADIQM